VTPRVLPPGVIGLVGWANRLLIVPYLLWAITVAWQTIRLRGQRRLGLAAPAPPAESTA
jgi:hypothetical protein